MTSDEQIDHFAKELDIMVERFRREYDEISYGALIGTMQMKIHNLCVEAQQVEEGK